jgi:hypothetical protein
MICKLIAYVLSYKYLENDANLSNYFIHNNINNNDDNNKVSLVMNSTTEY